MSVTTSAPPDPRPSDLEGIIRDLETSWTSTVTVKRQSPDDVGYREIIVSLDDESLATLRHGDSVSKDVTPGKHRLVIHNTLFTKKIDFSLTVGEHAIFKAVNRAGFLTYSVLAFFIGGGPIYLSVEREKG